jgi:PAS domain S-box-containing protein
MSNDTSQRLLHLTLLGEAIDCASGAAAFVWNDERRYVAVNEEACRLTGLSRTELVGMPVGDLSPDRAEGDIARTRSAPLVHGVSSFTRRDGRRVDLEWVTTHTKVAGMRYMVSLCWPTNGSDRPDG